jgi:8-oxo-dGTP pyrophosphatase MutT (NUDIX family)
MTIDAIRRALARPLPGAEAQFRMSPPYRSKLIERTADPARYKQAGVLLLLYPLNGQLYFPLTRRPDHVEHHKGQISFPGGARDKDESLRQTALREAREEIGIAPASVEVLGQLSSLFVPPSNFWIQPFVGYIPHRPLFDAAEREVAELIETPLAALLDPRTVRTEEWEIRGEVWPIPFYQFGPHKVWGATAMILAEFVALLELV